MSTRDVWQKALARGDVKMYQKFLKNMNLTVSDNPLEATAMDHGFIPESDGIAAVDLEVDLIQSPPATLSNVSILSTVTNLG